MKKMYHAGLLLVLLVVAFLTAGCETCRGAGKGMVKDVQNTMSKLPDIDAWMRKNLW